MISSVNNNEVKYLVKLQKRKYQERFNEIVVEGFHLVEQANKYNLVIQKYTIDNKYDSKAILISENVLQKITTTKHPQPIIAHIKKPEKLTSFEIEELASDQESKILILEAIQDPGNLGTILRTAKAFNFDLVILSKNSCSVYNPKTIQASQGAFMTIKTLIIEDLEDFINKYPRNYVATSLRPNSKSLQESKIKNPTLIFGNEGSGISDKILNTVNTHLKIMINDQVESLNIAIANAIALFHFFK